MVHEYSYLLHDLVECERFELRKKEGNRNQPMQSTEVASLVPRLFFPSAEMHLKAASDEVK